MYAAEGRKYFWHAQRDLGYLIKRPCDLKKLISRPRGCRLAPCAIVYIFYGPPPPICKFLGIYSLTLLRNFQFLHGIIGGYSPHSCTPLD